MLILYYFDFCPLFEFIISITILCHFYRYTYVSTLIPLIFHISTQILCLPTLIPCIRILVPFLAFPPLLSAFPSVHSPILHFDFCRQPAQFVINKNSFQENNFFSSNRTLLLLQLLNPWYRIIVYIIYDAISVISKNCLPYSASSEKIFNL